MGGVWTYSPGGPEFHFQANINSGVDFPFLKNNLKSSMEDKFEYGIFKFSSEYTYNEENYPKSALVHYHNSSNTINYEYFD